MAQIVNVNPRSDHNVMVPIQCFYEVKLGKAAGTGSVDPVLKDVHPKSVSIPDVKIELVETGRGDMPANKFLFPAALSGQTNEVTLTFDEGPQTEWLRTECRREGGKVRDNLGQWTMTLTIFASDMVTPVRSTICKWGRATWYHQSLDAGYDKNSIQEGKYAFKFEEIEDILIAPEEDSLNRASA